MIKKEKVDANIDSVISFLQQKREEGYKTVEVINKTRSDGWFSLDPKIEFIFNRSEHTVIGINPNI